MIGNRVKAKSPLFSGTGTVTHYDRREIFGVQVELDTPYDKHGHTIVRYAIHEIEVIENADNKRPQHEARR